MNHQIYRQRMICCRNVEENKKKISGCLSAIDFQEKNLPIRLLGDVVVFAKRTIHAVVGKKYEGENQRRREMNLVVAINYTKDKQ